MKYWILAIRPKTLLAGIAPVLLGLAIAYYETGIITITTAIITLVTTLFLQIASNLANDYLDAHRGVDSKSRLGPTRVTSSGLISSDKVRNALITTLILALITGSYLMWVGGIPIVLIGILSLYFAYGYTGGPFPLSYNGLGEIAAYLFFGVIAVSGTTYLQTHSFSKLSVILGSGPGFISAAILAINNLRDYRSDNEANKRTLAVRFGTNFQRLMTLSFILASSIISVVTFFIYDIKWILPAIILPLFFQRTWLQIAYHQIDEKLNHALAQTAKYNFFYCALTSVGMIIDYKLKHP